MTEESGRLGDWETGRLRALPGKKQSLSLLLSHSLLRDFQFWAVLFVALLAAWPAAAEPGLLNTRGGGDSPFLLQRLQQLVAAVADNHFPVRWMPDANYGYGYPFYNYYAPLSIYIAAFFRFLGFSFVRSIHLAQLAGFVVAGWGMARLANRWWGNRWAGWLAAVAYTFAPFHMVNVYTRGDSLAEFWAMAFYPWILLAADNLLQRPRSSRAVARFALAYAALILSHNISALIFSPFLLLYLLLRVASGKWQVAGSRWQVASDRWREAGSRLLAVGGGLLLALGLAAWFFLPALAEQALAQLEPVTAGYFHYSNHFRGLDLLQPNLWFDYSPDGGRAFRMGLIQTIAIVLGAGCLVAASFGIVRLERASGGRFGNPRHLFVMVAFLVATLMITPLSRPLWDHLPLLPFTQFPWRFLSVQAFAGALLTGAIAWLPYRKFVVPLVALALALGGLAGLKTDHLIISDEDVTPRRLAEYEWFTGNIGSTVSAEYLPPTAQPRPFSSEWLNSGRRDNIQAVAGTLDSAQLIERRATSQTWEVRTEAEGATVVLPTLYWPGWTATADRQPLSIRPHPTSGLIALDLPPGPQQVTLTLGRTPIRLAAELLSLAAIGIVACLLIADFRRKHKETKSFAPFAPLREPLLLLSLLLILAWLEPEPSLAADNLTWDFAQMGYLHHDVEGVVFDDGTHLQGYRYHAEAIAAGETLTISLNFTSAADTEATIELATPALARPTPDEQSPPPVFVAETRPLESQSLTFQLTIPADAPTGLVVPRLTLADARPLMPSGQTRGELFLRPLFIQAANQQQQVFNQPVGLDVATVEMVVREDNVLEGHFAWWTERPLGGNYHFSWRLQDANGQVLAQLDSQPGYGFQPSVGWPAGQPIHDWLSLRLPDSLSGSGPYPLVMRLYDSVGGEELLVRQVGLLAETEERLEYRPHTPNFALPDDYLPLAAAFLANNTPIITLHGYQIDQYSNTLSLTLYWEALEGMTADYIRFVHLVDAEAEEVVAQQDSFPQGNSYPTSQWTAQEIITDTVQLDLSNISPGTYRLAIGFYEQSEGLPRLPVVSGDTPLSDNLVILPDTIRLP